MKRGFVFLIVLLLILVIGLSFYFRNDLFFSPGEKLTTNQENVNRLEQTTSASMENNFNEIKNPLTNSDYFYSQDGNRILFSSSILTTDFNSLPKEVKLLHEEAYRWKKIQECTARRVFPNTVLTGENLEQATRNFLDSNLEYNINEANLIKKDETSYANRNLKYIAYEQTYQDVPVLFSHVGFALKGNTLALLNSYYYENIEVDTRAEFNEEKAIKIAQRTTQIIENPETPPRLVIYPRVKEDCSYNYHLAYEIKLVGKNSQKEFNPTVYVDAEVGKIIAIRDRTRYQNEKIFEGEIEDSGSVGVSGRIRGNIYPQHALETSVQKDFPHEAVYGRSGDSGPNVLLAFTQDDGTFSFAGTVQEFYGTLSGEFANVNNLQQQDAEFSVTPSSDTTQIHWRTHDTSYKQEESNAYYHTNVVHDFFTQEGVINVPELNYEMNVNVAIPYSCNAYYDGHSINFFQQGNECESTALSSDVIYHEYTHAMVDNVITVDFPYWGETGNMNEGYADYYACSINNNPCMAENTFFGWECLRSCENTNRYPDDYGDEPHRGLGIISGAFWDTRELLGQQTTDELAFIALSLQPQTFSQLLENVLIADDDNGNLLDGTPHIDVICNSFSDNHGINNGYCAGHTENPIVHISLPTRGQEVNGTVDIIGTAAPSRNYQGTGFSYSVQLTPPNVPAYQSQTIVVNNILHTLDTTLLNDGNYFIDLLVLEPGRTSSFSLPIKVNNVEFLQPLNYDPYRAGDTIELRAIFNVDNVETFSFEFAPEDDPSNIRTEGIVLENGGIYNGNELLGHWTLPQPQEAKMYRLFLRAQIANGNELVENVLVYVDPTLKQGWPVRVPFFFDPDYWGPGEGVYYWAGALEPVVADLENDGRKETIVYWGGDPPQIRVYNNDGSLLWTADIGEDGLPGGNLHIPVVEDVNNDGKKEIIVHGSNTDAYDWNDWVSKVYALNYDGTIQWISELPFDNKPKFLVSDLDFDGKKEIVMKGQQGTIRILKAASGEPIKEWSVPQGSWSGSIESLPSVGNLDNDRDLEIIVAYPNDFTQGDTSTLYAFNLDGTELFSRQLGGIAFSSPAVGDINNDGLNEIAVGMLFATGDAFVVLDSYGNTLWSAFPNRDVWTSPALFDYNNDGFLEIVVSKLVYPFETYVFDYQGNILNGWPQSTMWNDYYSPVVGDVNGDNIADILTTAGDGLNIFWWTNLPGGVYAWDILGNSISGFPKYTEVDAQAPAVIDDVDEDNNVDIIASSDWDFDAVRGMLKERGTLYAWETGNERFEESEHWPTFHKNLGRTGCYNCDLQTN